jgi:hypothetical protein
MTGLAARLPVAHRSSGQRSMSTLSASPSRITIIVRTSKPITSATLAQTGRTRASQKPSHIARMSAVAFRTLSP